MRLAVTPEPQAFVNTESVKFVRENGVPHPDKARSFAFEFPIPTALHEVFLRLPDTSTDRLPGATKGVTVQIFVQYKISDGPFVGDPSVEIPPPGQGYVGIQLREYIGNVVTPPPDPGVTHILHSSTVFPGTEAGEHQTLPRVLPANTRIVFEVHDSRVCTGDGQETIVVVMGAVASALGMAYAPGM